MHGVWTEPLVDQRRPHDFRRHAGFDVVVRKPPRCGLASAAATVCQPYRMTGPSGLESRSRQAGRRPDSRPLPGALPPSRRNLGFRSRSLMGPLVSWVPDYGNLSPWRAVFGGPHWLTLPGRFPHKPPTGSSPSAPGFNVIRGLIRRHFGGWALMLLSGGVSRVAKGADCKSAVLRLRRFESFFPHQYFQGA